MDELNEEEMMGSTGGGTGNAFGHLGSTKICLVAKGNGLLRFDVGSRVDKIEIIQITGTDSRGKSYLNLNIPADRTVELKSGNAIYGRATWYRSQGRLNIRIDKAYLPYCWDIKINWSGNELIGGGSNGVQSVRKFNSSGKYNIH